MRAEGERHAALISAVNLGSYGKKNDIERIIRSLTEPAVKQPASEAAFERDIALMQGLAGR